MGTKIVLPWPPRALSPNSRLHWAALAKAKKSYRRDCHLSALEHGVVRMAAESLTLRITAYPPDARRRDIDNVLASLKSGLDGLADAIGIDDSKWTLVLAPLGEVRKHGAVVVEYD